jgi:hypothetical protein
MQCDVKEEIARASNCRTLAQRRDPSFAQVASRR